MWNRLFDCGEQVHGGPWGFVEASVASVVGIGIVGLLDPFGLSVFGEADFCSPL